MMDSLQVWVPTPYFVHLTTNDSWEYANCNDSYVVNITYNDVVTGIQVNYRLVIYANIAENDL